MIPRSARFPHDGTTSSGGITGTHSIKVLPTPNLLFTDSVAPSASAVRFASDNPTPLP